MSRPPSRASHLTLSLAALLALLAAAVWAQARGAHAVAARARAAWQAPRDAAARAWLGLLWQQQPADPARTLAYAQALAQAEDWPGVVRVLTTVRRRGAHLPPAGYRLLAQAHARLGAPDAALATWRASVEAHPADAGLWTAYAQALDAAHRWPEALTAWQQAARHDPADARAACEAALHLAAYEPNAARPALEQAQTGPYAAQVQPVLRALEDAQTVGHPSYIRVQVGRGLAAVGRWDLATWAWARAVRSQPDYAPAWAYLGEGYHRLGWDAAAVGALRQAYHLAPHDPLPALLLGLHAQRGGRPFTALAWTRRAWATDPTDPALAAALANALTQALPGQLGPALAVLHLPPRAHPNDPAAWLTLARLALQWGLVEDQALPALRRVLALNPDHPQALALMGHAYARLGDPATAEQFLTRALQRDPGLAEAHLYLGWLYLEQARFADAAEHLRWAARLAPEGDPVGRLARRGLERLAPSP